MSLQTEDQWRRHYLAFYETACAEREVLTRCPFGAFRAERLFAHYPELQAYFGSVGKLGTTLAALVRRGVFIQHDDGVLVPQTNGALFFLPYRGGRTSPYQEHDAITDTWITVAPARYAAVSASVKPQVTPAARALAGSLAYYAGLLGVSVAALASSRANARLFITSRCSAAQRTQLGAIEDATLDQALALLRFEFGLA